MVNPARELVFHEGEYIVYALALAHVRAHASHSSGTRPLPVPLSTVLVSPSGPPSSWLPPLAYPSLPLLDPWQAEALEALHSLTAVRANQPPTCTTRDIAHPRPL